MRAKFWVFLLVGLLAASAYYGIVSYRGKMGREDLNAVEPPSADSRTPIASRTDGTESNDGITRKPLEQVRLWTKRLTDTGAALDPAMIAKAQAEGRAAVGREALFEATAGLDLGKVQQGEPVIIPLPGGGEASGRVNLVQRGSDGMVRLGGILTGSHTGTFSLGQKAGEMVGRVLVPDEKRAYLISTPIPGRTQVQELAMTDVICYPMPADMAGAEPGPRDTGPMASPPELRSRPGAAAVLYLDFDGAIVTDPDWNGGVTINAAAATLSSAEITEVWNRVKEDYWPFNINVTTKESDYTGAAVGSRMRVIITPTDTAAPGSGGVAYRDSFSRAGSLGFNSDVPCWVFNFSVDGIADAVSHELGHTLGLQHDRDTNFAPGTEDYEYYSGHGGTGPVSWGPIMGAAYTRTVVQWSKGEYPSADNTEDDVAIIAGTKSTPLTGATNNTGYVADDVGDTRAMATALDVSSGSLNVSGIISSSSDSDYFSFTLGGDRVVTINANPVNTYPKQPNLDILIELQDSGGTVLESANPDEVLNASLTRSLAAGTYYLKVVGTGRSGSGSDYGYSTYGSIGQYTITGSVIVAVPPVITDQTSSLSSTPGDYSQLYALATGNPTPSHQWQRLPAGSTDWADLSETEVFSGTRSAVLTILGLSTMDGDQFRCVVSNSGGTVVSTPRALQVTQLADALGWLAINFPSSGATGSTLSGQATVINAGTQAWGQNHFLILFDPQSQDAGAVSLNGILPGQSATVTISFTVPVTPNLSFAYSLRGRENGQGEFGAIRSFSFGTYGDATPPVIVTQPKGKAANVGDNITFNVMVLGQSPFAYQWRFNDSDIPGATGSSLTLAHVQVEAAGTYSVRITNALGSTVSDAAVLTVGIPPGVVSCAASGYYSVFVRSDGTRWALGYGFAGQLGDGTINGTLQPTQIDSGIVMVAAAPELSGMIKLDGSLWASGKRAGTFANLATSQQLSPVPVVNGTSVSSANLGYDNVYFVRTDGTLWAAGPNSSGQIGDGTTSFHNTPVQIATQVASVKAGNLHALFLKADGTVWGMGYGTFGALGSGLNNDVSSSVNSTPVILAQDVVAVAAGINCSTILKSDGSLWISGSVLPLVNSATFVQLASNVKKMAAGARHCLFIKGDGTLWSVGKNNAGQLGDGTQFDRSTPVQVASGVVDVSGGEEHSVFVKSDGSYWGMGSNQYYQLGSQAGIGSNFPVQLASGNVASPDAPASVSATDGSLPGMVRISWSHSVGASGYEIWRGTTSASSEAIKVAEVNQSAHAFDTNLPSGTVYYYWVKATNSAGASGFSQSDTGFSVEPTAPVISAQPANFSYAMYSPGLPVFSVAATGNPAPTYRWQVSPAGSGDWSDLSMGNSFFTNVLSPTLAFASGPWESFNGYQYRCVVTNSAGTVTSTAATLTVTAPAIAPVITTQPLSQIVHSGSPFSFSVLASGTPAPTYQWQRYNTDIPSATGTSYSSANAIAADAGTYRAIATNSAGSAISNSALLTVITPQNNFAGNGRSAPLWHNTNTGETRTWFSAGGSIGFGNEGGGWTVISSGDFDGDGFAEPLWRDTITGAIRTWFLIGGSIQFGNEGGGWIVIPTGTGDFDGDGRSEPLWRNTNTGAIRSWFAAGGALTFGAEGGGWTVIGSGDFDGDGFSEPLWRNTSTGAIRSWFLDGGSITLGNEGGGWSVIATATGDYAGDGRSEPLWRNTSTRENRTWLPGGGSVGFGLEGGGWMVISAGDFDGDGRAEPLWRNSTTGEIRAWTQTGASIGFGNEGGGWTVIY